MHKDRSTIRVPQPVRILDVVDNDIGTFIGASAAPAPGSRSATVAVLPAAPSDLADPTNTCRVGVEADFGAGFKHMAWGELWTGHTGAAAPSCAWSFDPANPPRRVRGVLECVTQCPFGLGISFA